MLAGAGVLAAGLLLALPLAPAEPLTVPYVPEEYVELSPPDGLLQLFCSLRD